MQCPLCSHLQEANPICSNCGRGVKDQPNQRSVPSEKSKLHSETAWPDDLPLPDDVAHQALPPYKLVLINAHTFLMGSPENEAGRDEDEQQHEVDISKDFWIGRTEVSQSLYSAVMNDNPSSFQSPTNPVESLTWLDAVLFCNAYSTQVGLEPVYNITLGAPVTVRWNKLAIGYRLPTEAEWEATMKQITQTPAAFIGWYAETSQFATHAVGQQIGISDMVGNVWEMCWDYYGPYPADRVVDPTGPTQGEFRVARGGSWIDARRILRPANRGFIRLSSRGNSVGFRLALTASGSG